MKTRFILLYIFYVLLFLFYPGDSYYFHIFAYNRDLFEKPTTVSEIKLHPIPYLKSPVVPEVTAEGVYIVDLPSFTPLYEKRAQEKFLPASTNKIMTALVASDVYLPDDVVQVKNIVTIGQTMGLVENERISVENLLYGTLIHSGNDAAQALADNYGTDLFVTLMNEKAKKLGMAHTLYKNPAGLDDFGQYTSPFDLALAARELLKNKFLRKVVSIKEITIADENFEQLHKLTNVNKLLGEVHGVGGLKTGYTENAGENLVSFYKKNGHEFIIVIVKSADRFEDTKNVVQWINEAVGYTDYSSNQSFSTAGT